MNLTLQHLCPPAAQNQRYWFSVSPNLIPQTLVLCTGETTAKVSPQRKHGGRGTRLPGAAGTSPLSPALGQVWPGRWKLHSQNVDLPVPLLPAAKSFRCFFRELPFPTK